MILSGSLLGYSVFENYTPIPLIAKFNKVEIFGEQIVDYLWIKNGTVHNSEISKINEYDYDPKWDKDTLFLAKFNDSLEAGNIVDDQIDGYSIYREEKGRNQLDFVQTVPSGTNNIVDYMPKNQTEYTYHMFIKQTDGSETRLKSEVKTTDWWNWQLMSLNPSNIVDTFTADEIFQFDLQLSSGSAEGNYDVVKIDGFTQFPKVAVGDRNYISGSIDALIGYVDSSGLYIDTVDMVNKLRNFVNNGKRKILKDRKGNIYEVSLSNFNFGYMDETTEQATRVTFNYIQVGDAKDLIVTN